MPFAVLAVLEKDGLDMGMAFEEPNDFGATVAAIADDTCTVGHGCLCAAMNKYTTIASR
jgi:hypothetical protein